MNLYRLLNNKNKEKLRRENKKMETKKRVELLAPAGNMEKLKTAFHF